ncbi:hypothetical protein [Timonella sp. A28]|uniref:hypothetical protein n=1 Tax=Timonella sp. A28 TaxID=3442640 RepID=UPI003EB8FADA
MSNEINSVDSFALHAWVDESMRTKHVSEPIYMLGACIADPLSCEDIRENLHRLRKKGPKLHWREMDNAAKKKSINLLNRIDVAHMVVVAAPMDPRRQERARAKCLERLLAELGEVGVSSVFLENRTQSLNDKDMRLIENLRGRKAMPRTLRVYIEVPSKEPMLWVPDQILGALGESEAGNKQWAERLFGNITRHDI